MVGGGQAVDLFAHLVYVGCPTTFSTLPVAKHASEKRLRQLRQNQSCPTREVRSRAAREKARRPPTFRAAFMHASRAHADFPTSPRLLSCRHSHRPTEVGSVEWTRAARCRSKRAYLISSNCLTTYGFKGDTTMARVGFLDCGNGCAKQHTEP